MKKNSKPVIVRIILMLSLLLLAGCGGGGGGTAASDGGSSAPLAGPPTVVLPPGTPPGPSTPTIPGGPTSPTNPPDPPPVTRTSSMLFQFVRAQSVLTVPPATVRLRFLFFTEIGGEGPLVMERVVDFAPSVRIESVPTSVRSVRISALDGNDNALFWSSTNVSLTESQETEVTWSFQQAVTAVELLLPEQLSLVKGSEQVVPLALRLSDQSVVQVRQANWSVDNANLLVDLEGRVIALSPGSSQITVRVGDLEAQMAVEITTPPVVSPTLVGISADPAIVGLRVGSKHKISGVGEYSNDVFRVLDPISEGVVFSSDSPEIVSVEADGTITAESSGTTVVRLRLGDFEATAEVTVEPSTIGNNRPPLVLFEDSLDLGNYPRRTIGQTANLGDVQVTDDQQNFESGRLELSVRSSFLATGAVVSLTAPALPNIGTVSGNGTRELVVSLTADATPATVKSFLEGISIDYQGPQGFLLLNALLDDGRSGSFANGTIFSMRGEAIFLTVNRDIAESATNFHTVHESIEVAVERAGPGSTITVAAGDYRAGPNSNPENLGFGANGELGNIAFFGSNRGISAGSEPGIRVSPTIFPPISLYARGTVEIDGIDFVVDSSSGGGVGIDGSLFYLDGMGASLSNCVFRSTRRITAGIETFTQDKVVLNDCLFEGGYAGVNSGFSLAGFEVSRCRFSNTPLGAYLSEPYGQTVSFQDCRFESTCDVAFQFGLVDNADSFQINNNAFLSPKVAKLDGFSVGSFDFRHNWWGQASGPRSDQIESASSFARLLTNPFLTSDPHSANP